MTWLAETNSNFERFFVGWTREAKNNWNKLHGKKELLESYRRLSALQAVKIDVLSRKYPSYSLSFFDEAHNDALVSHVSASIGAWRVALQSLRSTIENVFFGVYYAEHPVEYRLWESGSHRVGFSELAAYFDRHPDLEGLKSRVTGIAQLKKEYSTLSKAVHGTSKSFRMTDELSKVLLWSTAETKLSQWSTRERASLSNLCLFLVSLNRTELHGTRLPAVRGSLGHLFGTGLRQEVKASLSITINDPK